jgi:hypothetical protein
MEKSVKLKENFYLTVKDLKAGQAPQTVQKSFPTNFIFVIDVSGSMYRDVEMIRKQLKNKLPNLVKEGDTITLIWFSGKDQAGILKEEVEVKALTDLQSLNEAIDRYLKSICLTAFHKPLVLAKEAIGRIKKNRPSSVFSLVFLTDGYNNDCSWTDVMKSLKELEGDLAASTFVEYGYYADSRRINEMAQAIGGEKIDAQRFEDYDVVFEAKLKKSYSSAKRIVVDVPVSSYDFAFTVADGEIILYSINNGQVTLPESTLELCYFKSTPSTLTAIDNSVLYAALYVLSDKMLYDEADYVFQSLGDKYLYNLFVNAYGKQKLMNFKALVKDCVTDVNKRYLDGRSDSLVVNEDAYSVMNFIDDLTNDEEALFFPFHDDFNYKRIGAKKVQQTGLTDAEKQLIMESKSIEDIKAIVEAAEGRDVEFEYADKTKGYPITDIVWSSSRANLSVRVRYEGYVNLPKNKFGIEKIDTFIYRTYTLIKDGILNLNILPVKASDTTIQKFVNQNLNVTSDVNQVLTVDFSPLPVINRKMVKNISAKTLAEKEYKLFEMQALEKVYKYYEGKHFPRVSQGFVDIYGAEAEAWLKELGITQFNGFAPKSTQEEGSDVYMAVELNTKIAKHSSLGKVEDVIAKVLAGKSLNGPESLMAIAVRDYETQINSAIFTSLTDQKLKDEILKNWLSKVKNNVKVQRKQLLQEIAQIKFALILSKKWFTEFKSFDENKMTLPMNGSGDVDFTFDLIEKEVAI